MAAEYVIEDAEARILQMQASVRIARGGKATRLRKQLAEARRVLKDYRQAFKMENKP